MNSENKKNIYLSGMQSSGNGILHLGNYIGAILNWKKLIKIENSIHYFMLADLHAMTNISEPIKLHESSLNQIAMYIACGIESENVIIFRQSDINRYHEALFWLLLCKTPMGWLNRMTQFKDKKNKNDNEMTECGLYCYPILMACDILLYNTNFVPVGDDQKQHIEFTADLAARINHFFKKDLFVIPKELIQNGTRIMSLSDGTKKMSKSDPNPKGTIFLTDTNDEIFKKIASAKTDSIKNPYFDKENRPDVSNLINIASILSGDNFDSIQSKCNDSKSLKDFLSQVIISEISPIREKYNSLIKDKVYLEKILKKNSEIMSEIAQKTYESVKNSFF